MADTFSSKEASGSRPQQPEMIHMEDSSDTEEAPLRTNRKRRAVVVSDEEEEEEEEYAGDESGSSSSDGDDDDDDDENGPVLSPTPRPVAARRLGQQVLNHVPLASYRPPSDCSAHPVAGDDEESKEQIQHALIEISSGDTQLLPQSPLGNHSKEAAEIGSQNPDDPILPPGFENPPMDIPMPDVPESSAGPSQPPASLPIEGTQSYLWFLPFN